MGQPRQHSTGRATLFSHKKIIPPIYAQRGPYTQSLFARAWQKSERPSTLLTAYPMCLTWTPSLSICPLETRSVYTLGRARHDLFSFTPLQISNLYSLPFDLTNWSNKLLLYLFVLKHHLPWVVIQLADSRDFYLAISCSNIAKISLSTTPLSI